MGRKYWYEVNHEGEKVKYTDSKRTRVRTDKEGNIHVPTDKEYFGADGKQKFKMEEFIVTPKEHEKFIKYQKRYNKERKAILKERIKEVEKFNISKVEKENAIENLKSEYKGKDLKLKNFATKRGFERQTEYMRKHSTKGYLKKANANYKRNYIAKVKEVFNGKYAKDIIAIVWKLDGGQLFALRSTFDCLGLDFLYDDIQQENKYNQIMSAFQRLGYTTVQE